jgi:L-aminopeptidase/D-esterase-like protein
MSRTGDILDVPGVRVGHAEDRQALTGCTVVLFPEEGAVAGMEQLGGAPGTRETDLLHPLHLVDRIHGLVLTGGSAFGLDAASGVVSWLEEHGIGLDTGSARVPIVPAAVIYDLSLGDARVRPDATMGRKAVEAARGAEGGPLPQGNVGAGVGATVGKILGIRHATKAGQGSASLRLPNGVVVGALMVVNAFGDVVDPGGGQIIAGARNPGGDPLFVDTVAVLRERSTMGPLRFGRQGEERPMGTVIGLVAVGAEMTKEEANIVARMAMAGLARTCRPTFTMLDGDTIFVAATGGPRVDTSTLGAVAADLVAEAVLQGVRAAESAGGIPCWRELGKP